MTRLNLQFEVLDDDIVEATEPVQLVLGTSGSERAVQFPLGGGGGVASGEILDDNDCKTELISILDRIACDQRNTTGVCIP